MAPVGQTGSHLVQSTWQLYGFMTRILGRSTAVDPLSGGPVSKTPGLHRSAQASQPLHSAVSIVGNQAISSRATKSRFLFFTGFSMPLTCSSVLIRPAVSGRTGVTSVQILDEVLELLLRRKCNGPGGTDGHASGAKHQAIVGMRDDQLRTVDSRRIGRTGFEHTGLAEDLAVTATVTELRFHRRKPGDFLAGCQEPFSFFRGSRFRNRRFGRKRRSFRFHPRSGRIDGRVVTPVHRARFEHQAQGPDEPECTAVTGWFRTAPEKAIKNQHNRSFVVTSSLPVLP